MNINVNEVRKMDKTKGVIKNEMKKKNEMNKSKRKMDKY